MMNSGLPLPPSVSVNQNGGVYKPGNAYDVVKKVGVAVVYANIIKKTDQFPDDSLPKRLCES